MTDLAWASDSEITIKKMAFSPSSLRIKVGTTVTFRNADDVAHSVVAADRSFNSREVGPGKSFSYTFKNAGNIMYFCGVHLFMEGQVVVTP